MNNSGISTNDVETDLGNVKDEAANSSEKKMVLQHLKEVLRKIEDLDENTEWQRLEQELREEFERLEKAQNDLGNDKTGQLVNQLRKLHNIKKVKVLTPEASFEKELMLIKVKSTSETRSEILAATEVYKGKILDYTLDTMSIEVTGDPQKINAFIEIMASIGIIEMCRTGVVAIERGTSSI